MWRLVCEELEPNQFNLAAYLGTLPYALVSWYGAQVRQCSEFFLRGGSACSL